MLSCKLRYYALAVGALFYMAVPSITFSTELAPWFGELYLPILRGNYTYEHFYKVSTPTGSQSYTAYCEFLDRSIDMTFDPQWNAQIEWGGASTRNSHWGFDYLRATARYLIMDDVGGEDPVSLAAGVTFTRPWHYRLKDVSMFHHSLYDTELHVAVGKEFPCGPIWAERCWILAGYGQGSRGSGWVHGIAAVEKNIRDIHQFRLSLDYLRGLGRHNIININDFSGYASISHQSLDFIFHYQFSIPTYFDITLEYMQRLSARNCPQGVIAGSIGIVWPFPID